MADSLDNKDSGKIKAPRIDGAMNKLPPVLKDGGKGAKEDGENTRLGSSHKKEQELLARARKRMDRAIQAEAQNRAAALEDLEFIGGKQWPAEVQAQRQTDKRPCHTVNKLPTFVHQITNDLRQNRPSIVISPMGDKGDREVALMYRGLIRAIERDSAADIAYDTGAESAVRCGIGYWRVLTEYESEDSFDQVIRIGRVRNPFTVYLDPDHKEPDGADAKWGFISEMMPREDFEDLYPNADPMPWTQSGVGETLKNWIDQKNVRIAEYFEVETKSRKLIALSNGHVGWEDELGDDALGMLQGGILEIVQSRDSEVRSIKWHKLSAVEVLEEIDWMGKWIPIVKIIGDEIDIEGKVKYSGIVRNAKDAQRMVNYWETAFTEMVALAPKSPWVVEEGQIENYETQWKMANVKSYAYLPYKATNIAGHPVPPPQRQPFSGIPEGIQQGIANSAQNMMATTGVRFDATMHERTIDESGKAIRELRRFGDIGSFHYVDNFARSLRQTGRILLDLIPKVYDTRRMLTLVREDDTEEQVQIDPSAPKPMQETVNPQNPAKKLKIFNPTYGQYGVTVTIGPSYATKRIEASENMMAFVKALPNTANLIADLIAKTQDWPGADEMARRLAKVVPPELLAPDQKNVPPQMQALLQGMDRQIKQLHTQLATATKALVDKEADRQVARDKINKDFEAKLLKIVADVEKTIQTSVADKITAAIAQAATLLTTKSPPPDGANSGATRP